MKQQTLSKHQVIGLGLIALFIGIMVSGAVVATTIATDPERDLRAFNLEWLEANLPSDIDDWRGGALNTIYRGLRDNWDTPDASRELTTREYSRYNYIDITSITITGLDEENATLTVNLVGNIEEATNAWLLFIWSNCSGDGSGLTIIAAGIPGGMGGEDITGFMAFYGDETANNTSLDHGAGSEINMEFPSAWWDDSDTTCTLHVVILTGDVDNPDEWYFDIYPNAPEVLPCWFLWILLIILALIAIIVIYYLYKRSKRKRQKTTKRQITARR